MSDPLNSPSAADRVGFRTEAAPSPVNPNAHLRMDFDLSALDSHAPTNAQFLRPASKRKTRQKSSNIYSNLTSPNRTEQKHKLPNEKEWQRCATLSNSIR